MKHLASLVLLCLAQSVDANDGALRQCRTLQDAVARLACYDAMPLLPGSPSATAAAPAMPTPDLAAPLASFGLPRSDDKVLELVSSIAGAFEGWQKGSRIRLANGQVWQVTDDSSAIYALQSPKVTVRRAALGSFVLDIEGANRTPRVRRVE